MKLQFFIFYLKSLFSLTLLAQVCKVQEVTSLGKSFWYQSAAFSSKMGDSDISQSSHDQLPATETTIPASLKFLMTNLKAVAAVSLTSENYPIWSTQVLKLFRANGYESFLTGTNIFPNKHLPLSDGTTSINRQYTHWQILDQNLSAALLSTVSTAILPYILNLETTSKIWSTLLKRHSSILAPISLLVMLNTNFLCFDLKRMRLWLRLAPLITTDSSDSRFF